MMIKTDLRLYSAKDVARMFRVVPSRIRTLIGHSRIPDARYVGSSWAIPEGSEVLPDPETELSPAEMYAKHGGNITRYIALCAERGVPAQIPTHEWFEPEPPGSHRKLTDVDIEEMARLREKRGMSFKQLGTLFKVHPNTVRNALTGESWAQRQLEPCPICSGKGVLTAENEQFGPMEFQCRECRGTGVLS